MQISAHHSFWVRFTIANRQFFTCIFNMRTLKVTKIQAKSKLKMGCS